MCIHKDTLKIDYNRHSRNTFKRKQYHNNAVYARLTIVIFVDVNVFRLNPLVCVCACIHIQSESIAFIRFQKCVRTPRKEMCFNARDRLFLFVPFHTVVPVMYS